MLNKQHYILTLLSAFFIIASGCHDSDLIGLDIDENEKINTGLITTFVDISTVPEEAAVANGLAQNPFGYVKDPVFGDTEANLALSFNLPSTSFSFGTEPEIDSAVIVLQYGNEIYGDSLNSVHQIRAYELDTALAAETYYTNKTWKHKTEVLATKTTNRFSWGDSVDVSVIVDGQPDSVRRVQPHLRIKLDNQKISSLLLNAPSSSYTTDAAFRRYLKGIYLTVDKTTSTGTGALTFFDLSSSGNISGLQVYYKSKNSEGVLDTSMVLFPTSSSIAASNVKHNHPASITDKEGNANVSEVFVQPLSGYRAKLKFNELDVLRGLVAPSGTNRKSVSINRAELVIQEVGETSSIFKPAPRLTMYRTDIAGVRKPLPDNAIGTDPRYFPEVLFGGYYNSEKREYRFVITSYIQDLLNGTLTEYDTYIAPFRKNLTGAANISASATTAARAVLGGKNHPNTKIQLNVIYTKPD